MGKPETINFVVDTVGHCFICMEEIRHQFLTNESGNKSSTSPSCSMKCVSRYLNLKMRKVFQQEELIPENLLDRVETSTLKVALCDECASWNAKLSSLIRQLEKIEVEAVSFVQLINDKLKRADADGKSNLSGKLVDQDSELMGKLQIAEALRKETAHKCSRKIQTSKPKLRIKKLTDVDIVAAKDKLKRSSRTSKLQQIIPSSSNAAGLPIRESQMNDFKHEYDGLDETTSYIENDYADDLEHQYTDSEQKVLSTQPEAHSRTDFPINLITVNSTQQKYTRNLDTGKFKCSLCTKESASAPVAHLHYQTVHLNVRFKCGICGKTYTSKQNLTTHQQKCSS